MLINVVGRQVESEQFGFLVTLRTVEGDEFQIETDFEVRSPNGVVTVRMGTDHEPPVSFRGEVISAASARESGELDISFESGMALTVGADPGYESWSFVGVDGARLVSTPGGDLAIWDPLEG